MSTKADDTRSGRDAILDAIRLRRLPELPRPDLNQQWTTYEDPVAQFTATLEAVGGSCVEVNSESEIASALEKVDVYREANEVCSTLAGIDKVNVDMNGLDDPHALETVDFAILRGEFGVAENGAIWVTDDGVSHRVVYFLVQHLALVLRRSEIVNNMHEAYERLSFDAQRFGCFVSGPSKTADIEQSLVIGAHGPRSLHVFLVDN